MEISVREQRAVEEKTASMSITEQLCELKSMNGFYNDACKNYLETGKVDTQAVREMKLLLIRCDKILKYTLPEEEKEIVKNIRGDLLESPILEAVRVPEAH
jgi:hypothetical protein